MPTIALLTDFGLRDHYVGVVHLILNAKAPGASRIDLCHEIPFGDIRAASFCLLESWHWLQEETIVLAVVDPGVGSSRRAVAARLGRKFIVGPDNGLLRAVGDVDEAYEIRMDPASSSTFHGRDLFAPAAALLARGESPRRLGPEIDPSSLQESLLPVARRSDHRWSGEILHIDTFGNIITNIPFRKEILSIVWPGGESRRVVKCYAEAPPGEICFLRSSSTFLEVMMRGRSAAEFSCLRVGDPITAYETQATSTQCHDLMIDP